MSKSGTVTCSFSLDMDIYNSYKSIVIGCGENVKGNLIRYMENVIDYGTSNPKTIEAIREVEKMKADSELGKSYDNVDETISEILNDLQD